MKTHKFLTHLATVAALVCFSLETASAQDFTPTFTWTDASINNAGLAAAHYSRRSTELNGNTPSVSARTKSNPTLRLAPVSYSYVPSLQRRQQNLASFVAKVRATDLASANNMAQSFSSGDIIAQIDTKMRGIGLRADNAADAYAVWWVSAWQAAKGDTQDWDAATYQAVSRQVTSGFAATLQFATPTDTQKQLLAEEMLVNAALIDATKDDSAGNPLKMRALATAVQQGAMRSGLNLSSMTLTRNGFVFSRQ
jgi:hypothetical protein